MQTSPPAGARTLVPVSSGARIQHLDAVPNIRGRSLRLAVEGVRHADGRVALWHQRTAGIDHFSQSVKGSWLINCRTHFSVFQYGQRARWAGHEKGRRPQFDFQLGGILEFRRSR